MPRGASEWGRFLTCPAQAAEVGSRESGAGSQGPARWLRSVALGLTLSWCGLASAAEPESFAPDAFAQPLAAGATDAPLRWKSKPLGASQTTSVNSQPVARTSSARGWNTTRIDGQVRQAQFTSSDPFNDPFGDGSGLQASGVQQASDIELEPTDAESGRPGATPTIGVEELPAPRPLSTLNAPSARLRGPAFVAQPADPGITQPSQSDRNVPCERVYNDRNCCALDADCKEFRERLISNSIRNISLDITPRFEPNLTPEEDLAARQDRLSAADKFRQWKNRRGEVVANGRMSDLADARVVIVDEENKEVTRIALHELGADELCWVNAYWHLPGECPLGGTALASRNWLPSTYHWHASALCHKPLYFEEVQLERYGHTAGPFRQPVLSGAHFFLNIAALPYNMAINPPHECQYALGYYRPGSCAPWMIQPVPLSLRGAVAEVTAVVGGIYLIP